MVALSKSQNKHNRLYMKAEPLGEAVSADIESGKINSRDDFKGESRRVGALSSFVSRPRF